MQSLMLSYWAMKNRSKASTGTNRLLVKSVTLIIIIFYFSTKAYVVGTQKLRRLF